LERIEEVTRASVRVDVTHVNTPRVIFRAQNRNAKTASLQL
jgi:hypothetical protein